MSGSLVFSAETLDTGIIVRLILEYSLLEVLLQNLLLGLDHGLFYHNFNKP
jgi:hypothetical protein